MTYDVGRGAAIETFLVRCAHRAMLDLVRSERRQTGHWISGDAPISAESPDSLFDNLAGSDPHADPYQEMLFSQVALALEQLPQRQRECIQLSYYDGHTNSQIATSLGISRPRVTQLLNAGLKQLRARLEFHALAAAPTVN